MTLMLTQAEARSSTIDSLWLLSGSLTAEEWRDQAETLLTDLLASETCSCASEAASMIYGNPHRQEVARKIRDRIKARLPQ